MSKKLGQYFTASPLLQDKVFEFIKNSPEKILEPCVGQGDLVKKVLSKFKEVSFDCYEIDESIPLLSEAKEIKVIYRDFLKEEFRTKRYTTIIGNPPYISTKSGNVYLDFTEKCFKLLEDYGELIFIVPSDFFKLTSAAALLSKMYENGTFTHIFHPHDEKLFEQASIDVVIYRYCKGLRNTKETICNDVKMYSYCKSGMITFSRANQLTNTIFSDVFDIYVGLVSGKESIYKNKDLGNIDVVTGIDIVPEKYILLDNLKDAPEKVVEYLNKFKSVLLSRKIRKFNENNWFEWGALRNIKVMKENTGKECIYISNLSRKESIAFSGKVNFFGGNLLMIIAKDPFVNTKKAVEYLNSTAFRENFTFSGRFKIGQRQLCNAYFPGDLLDVKEI